LPPVLATGAENQTLRLNVLYQLNLDTIWADPEFQQLRYEFDAPLPTGVVQKGDRGQSLSGIPTVAGSYPTNCTADDTVGAEDDWLARSTLSNMVVAENFSNYANRGELLAHYQQLNNADTFPQNGVKNSYYPNGGVDGGRCGG
jgi:hypothetical protein